MYIQIHICNCSKCLCSEVGIYKRKILRKKKRKKTRFPSRQKVRFKKKRKQAFDQGKSKVQVERTTCNDKEKSRKPRSRPRY